MAKSKRTRALEIPLKVKEKVYERDNGCCVVCGRRGAPNAHYIPRSQGGLGIEENILTLDWNCHLKFDQSTDRPKMKAFFKKYLMSKYPNWNEEKLVYKKGE